MKLFLVLFGLIITASLHGQHCNKLESFRFFSSVQFGKKLPADLISSGGKGLQVLSHQYNLHYDSLSTSFKKKYADLFKFSTSSFSDLQIWTNKNGEMYYAALSTTADMNDSVKLESLHLPALFKGIYNKLTQLFGKETGKKDMYSPDSAETLGISRNLTWECGGYITVELRFNYGPSAKQWNNISLIIFDRKFETIEEIKTL